MSAENLGPAIGKTCVKCDLEARFTGIDPKKAWYCRECFIQMVKNKFRSAISKKKLYQNSEERETLIVYDGTPSAVFLISQIDDALKQITFKRLMVKPTVLVLISATDRNVIQTIMKRVAEIKLHLLDKVKWIVSHVAFCMSSEMFGDITYDSCNGEEQINGFTKLLDSCLVPTYREEIERILKEKCILKICEALRITKCMLPQDADDLGRICINQLCLGRGGALSSLVSVVDKRSSHFAFIRPLKDVSKKEITIVNHLTQIDKHCIQIDGDAKNRSIQSLTDDFIRSLEKEQFYSTINTVLSTATKIHPISESASTCVFCQVETESSCMTCTEIRTVCDRSLIDPFFAD